MPLAVSQSLLTPRPCFPSISSAVSSDYSVAYDQIAGLGDLTLLANISILIAFATEAKCRRYHHHASSLKSITYGHLRSYRPDAVSFDWTSSCVAASAFLDFAISPRFLAYV